MKKKAVLFIILILAFALTACSNHEEKADGANKDIVTENIKSSENMESEQTEKENTDDSWGVDENTITEKNGVSLRAHIKLPYRLGMIEGTGKIAHQPDDSLIILGSEVDFNEPEVEDGKIENIFPAYFEKAGEIIAGYMVRYKDFEFETTSKETLTVNGYEMCKYTGKLTFASREDSYERNFVAYATRLKGNDAVVYWIVIDGTVDQSLSEVIESYADKMAQTLHE